MEFFLVSWVTFIILRVPRHFLFYCHVHGVFLSCSYSEAYSINDVVSHQIRFFLSTTFSHPILYVFSTAYRGESATELNRGRAYCSADTTGSCHSNVNL